MVNKSLRISASNGLTNQMKLWPCLVTLTYFKSSPFKSVENQTDLTYRTRDLNL